MSMVTVVERTGQEAGCRKDRGCDCFMRAGSAQLLQWMSICCGVKCAVCRMSGLRGQQSTAHKRTVQVDGTLLELGL